MSSSGKRILSGVQNSCFFGILGFIASFHIMSFHAFGETHEGAVLGENIQVSVMEISEAEALAEIKTVRIVQHGVASALEDKTTVFETPDLTEQVGCGLQQDIKESEILEGQASENETESRSSEPETNQEDVSSQEGPSSVSDSSSASKKPNLVTYSSIEGLGDIDEIITVGEKVINVISKSKSTVEFEKSPVAHVIPKQAKCWTEFSNWLGPKFYRVQFDFSKRGIFGNRLNIVNATLILSFMYGGQYNGKGQYLQNVMVYPRINRVAPFWSLKSNVELFLPSNYGSKSDPIAGLQLKVTNQYSTFLRRVVAARTLAIKGNGDVVDDYIEIEP